MALPSTSVLDDFNRANEGPPPSASWASDDMSVVSNRMVPAIDGEGNTFGEAIWIAPFSSADQEAYISIFVDQALAEASDVDSPSLFFIYLRNVLGVSQYALRMYIMPPLFANPGTVNLSLLRNGILISSQEIVTYTSGDTFALSVADNVLTGYHRPAGGNWAAIVSAYDSNLIDVGQTGVVANGNSGTALTSIWSFDDFGGGEHTPTQLEATAVSASQINLVWSDTASDETGWSIERSPDGLTSWVVIDTTGPDVTTRTNTGLSPATTYYYRVRAFNVDGNYDYSNIASATTMAPPSAPTLLTATAVSSSRIDLAWTDNATNENGYKIERGTDGINFVQIAVVGPSVDEYNDNNLSVNTLYYYRVRAFNDDGDSDYSNIASARTLARCEGGYSYFDVLLRAARLLENLHEGQATANGSITTLVDSHLGAFIGSGDDDFNGGSLFWKSHAGFQQVTNEIIGAVAGAFSFNGSLDLPPLVASSVGITLPQLPATPFADDGAGSMDSAVLTETDESIDIVTGVGVQASAQTFYRQLETGTVVSQYGSDSNTATDDGAGNIDVWIPVTLFKAIGTVTAEQAFSGNYPAAELPATPGGVTIRTPGGDVTDDGAGAFATDDVVLTGELLPTFAQGGAGTPAPENTIYSHLAGNITAGSLTVTWDDGGTPEANTDDGAGNIDIYLGATQERPAMVIPATIDYTTGVLIVAGQTEAVYADMIQSSAIGYYTQDVTYKEIVGTIQYTAPGAITLNFAEAQTGLITVVNLPVAPHFVAAAIDYTTGVLSFSGLDDGEIDFLVSSPSYNLTYGHRAVTGTIDYATGALSLSFDRAATGDILASYQTDLARVFLPIITRVTDFAADTGTVTFEPSSIFEMVTLQGDRYGLSSRRFPYYLMLQKLNEALGEIKHYVLDQADIAVAEAGTLSATNTNEIDLPDTVRIFKIWNGNTDQDPQDWQLVSRFQHQNGKVRFYDYLPWNTIRIQYFADIPDAESETDCLPQQIDATWLAYEVAVKCCRWRLFQPGEDEKSLTTQINDLMARATRAKSRMNLYQPQQAAMKLPIIPDR